jgi:DNA-binding transcriptional LysR family regulator
MQQIEVFLAVANSRSISAAARELFISQPAVSSTIASMEREWGVTLLTRSNRGAELTVEGRRLYAELDPVYKRFALSADRILRKAGTGALNLGSFHDPDAIRFMLAAAEKHREAYPDLRVTTEYFNHNELRGKLLCEELDAVFTFSFEVIGDPDLDCLRLCALEQFFIVPAAYGDIGDAGFRLLRNMPLILEVSSGRETALNICAAHGFEPARIKYVNSYLLPAQMVADGEGFFVGGRNLPNLGAFASRVAFVPVAARDCNEYVHLVAAWRRRDDRPEVKRLISILEMPGLAGAAVSIREAPGSKWYG